MISIDVSHDAGLGSLLTVLMSQLAKMPLDQDVHIRMNSKLYAPGGENMFEWWWSNWPLPTNVTVWTDTTYCDKTHPSNVLLGKDSVRLASLRQLADRRFRCRASQFVKMVNVIGSLQHLPHPLLGIHYRGTDKHTEIPRVPFDQVFECYKRQPPHAAVFLATDEIAAVEWFSERIPGLLVNPHIRSATLDGIHIGQGSQQHAEEAMLDILTLGVCDTLLLGRGNFSDMALIFGRTQNILYPEAE